MNKKVHIGEIIDSKLKEDGRYTRWLAERIYCERANVYKLLNKSSLETSLLLQISIVMKHNFFSYYSDYYNNNASQ